MVKVHEDETFREEMVKVHEDETFREEREREREERWVIEVKGWIFIGRSSLE